MICPASTDYSELGLWAFLHIFADKISADDGLDDIDAMSLVDGQDITEGAFRLIRVCNRPGLELIDHQKYSHENNFTRTAIEISPYHGCGGYTLSLLPHLAGTSELLIVDSRWSASAIDPIVPTGLD